MSTPDAIDEKIVRLLAKDARQSYGVLANQLGLSSATVRRRMRRLMREGILRIVGVIDPTKFNMALTVLIAIDIDTHQLESAVDTLAKRPEIRWVAITTGRYDIITQARFASNEYLAEFLKNELPNLPGMKDVETFICLDIRGLRYISLPQL